MKAETIAQRSIAYGIPGIRVDGNDVLAMYVASAEAVERARAGKGPSLIEGLTYRVTPHTTADDPKKYRSEEEVKEWVNRDCLLRFSKYLVKKGVYSEADLKKVDEEVDAKIKEAVKRFEELAKSEELLDPMAMFDYTYADIPPFLQEQRDELSGLLKKESGSGSAGKKQAETARRHG